MAIHVSEKWKTSIAAPFRDVAFLRVSVMVEPPNLKHNMTVESPNTYSHSDINIIRDGILRNDITPVATLEQDRWILDGTMEFIDSGGEIDWWSTEFVSESNPVVFTFTFDAPYDIPGVFGVWDTVSNTWPTKVNIKGYDSSNVLLGEYNITDVSSTSYFMRAPFDNCNKVVITITEWSVEGWRARCTELAMGFLFEADSSKITDAATSSRASILSEELPVWDARVTFLNYDDSFDRYLNKRVQSISFQSNAQLYNGA